AAQAPALAHAPRRPAARRSQARGAGRGRAGSRRQSRERARVRSALFHGAAPLAEQAGRRGARAFPAGRVRLPAQFLRARGSRRRAARPRPVAPGPAPAKISGVKLHATAPGARNAFSGYGEGYVLVNGARYESSLVVTPERVLPWSVARFE